jgi:hypothetical protein
VITLPTTSIKAKSYTAAILPGDAKLGKARQKLSIKILAAKTRKHKNTYTCIFY